MASDTYTDDQPLDARKNLGVGEADDQEEPAAPVKTERQLDKALKDTLDCSDPLPANPGAD